MAAIRKQFLNDQDDYSTITTEKNISSISDVNTAEKVTPWSETFKDEHPSSVQNNLFGPGDDDDDDDDDDLIPVDDDDDDDLIPAEDDDDDVLPDGGDDDLLNDDEDDFLAEEEDDDLLADNDDDTGAVDDDEDDDYDGDVRSVGDLRPPSERSHGRTSGRMIDHEPGTPNNI
ncbi:MAG: hypothetical protein JWN56_2951 [Sphingobacteriales bacterium]|nr:hypothetical protein [Sphingobacteriales bacterium]